jgi:DNA (cytosine-5)-methyltransferase 1
MTASTGLVIAGLFAGIGGAELGLATAGHEARLLVENHPPARHVLRARFPGTTLEDDVRDLSSLPAAVELVVAGFPCQDLSSVGQKVGIGGSRSGLVAEVFRLLRTSDVPWVVLENVPFLLSLDQGRAMSLVTQELTALGYSWAYRVLDSMAFGLPQRRNRWYLVASRTGDPRDVLLVSDVPAARETTRYQDHTCGFYWTEGRRAFGWTVDGVPPVKCGSSLGVPSPPALRRPDGSFRLPDIRDAERLQGFPVDWTAPVEQVARRGERWRLVGNAISVPVAGWIGRQLVAPGRYDPSHDRPLGGQPWPRRAAWATRDGVVHGADVGPWPVWYPRPSLTDFLQFDGTPLSRRAALGFLHRTGRGTLRFPDGFLAGLEAYAAEAP